MLNAADGVLDRAAGVVRIVEVLVGDLPPEDAAVVVDVLEVVLGAAGDVAGRGGLAAQRHAPAELDFRGGDAGRGFGAGACAADDDGRDEDCEYLERQLPLAQSSH